MLVNTFSMNALHISFVHGTQCERCLTAIHVSQSSRI